MKHNVRKVKYEYLLHVWGGFWSYGLPEIHGDKDVPYRWFDTAEDRQKEMDRIDALQKSMTHPYAIIAMSTSEGYLTRYEFVLQSKVLFRGKIHTIENNMGYGFWSDKEIDQLGDCAAYMKEWKWDISGEVDVITKGSEDYQRLFTTLILR